MKITVKQFAEKTGLDEKSAYTFLTFLKDAGLATVAVEPKEPGLKGKGPNAYTFEKKYVQLVIGTYLDKLES